MAFLITQTRFEVWWSEADSEPLSSVAHAFAIWSNHPQNYMCLESQTKVLSAWQLLGLISPWVNLSAWSALSSLVLRKRTIGRVQKWKCLFFRHWSPPSKAPILVFMHVTKFWHRSDRFCCKTCKQSVACHERHTFANDSTSGPEKAVLYDCKRLKCFAFCTDYLISSWGPDIQLCNSNCLEFLIFLSTISQFVLTLHSP